MRNKIIYTPTQFKQSDVIWGEEEEENLNADLLCHVCLTEYLRKILLC
jgi:hypothetical protein